MLVIHVDGDARGHPGPAAIGVVIARPDGEVIEEIAERTQEIAERTLESWSLETVPRGENARADALVKCGARRHAQLSRAWPEGRR